MAYEPKHLKRWTLPDNYVGEVWPAYYSSGCGQSRDSDALERSNFSCMLKALGGESETVIVVRETHWLVGWVEWIAIHQDDDKALEIADRIAARNPGGKRIVATDSTRSPKANSSTCPYRKSNPGTVMMETAQDRAADNIPGPLGAARDRGILVQ
jgi:hypothetical protein